MAMGPGLEAPVFVHHIATGWRKYPFPILPEKVPVLGEKGLDRALILLGGEGAGGIDQHPSRPDQVGSPAEELCLEEMEPTEVLWPHLPLDVRVPPQHSETGAGCIHKGPVEAPG
jgi:hypothetical protein